MKKNRFNMESTCKFIDGYVFLLSDKIRNALLMAYLTELVEKTNITCREYNEVVSYINNKLGAVK